MADLERLENGRIRVTFAEAERQLLWKWAKERNWRKNGDNVGARKYGQDPLEIHYMGLLGEGAFAAHRGIPFSEIKVYRGHGDDGVDFELAEGKVQVKATRRRPPNLWFGSWESTEADFYVQAWWDKSRRDAAVVELIGAIGRDRLLSYPDDLVLKGGKNRDVPEADLVRLSWPEDAEEEPDAPRPRAEAPEPARAHTAPLVALQPFCEDAPADGPGILAYFAEVFDEPRFADLFR